MYSDTYIILRQVLTDGLRAEKSFLMSWSGYFRDFIRPKVHYHVH